MSQIKDFKLPDLGEGLEEGEIVAWHVAEGDVIELNQTVADIETAKAVVAVPSPFAGLVVELVGEVGDTLEVGSVFVRIDISDGAVAEVAIDPASDVAARSATPSTGLDADEEPQPLVGYGQSRSAVKRRRRGGVGGTGNGQAAPTTPLAKPPVRKLAKDLGVDLAAISPGSAAGGVITREDVQAAASTSAPATSEPTAPAPLEKPVPGFRGRAPGEVEQIRGIRKRIVEKMELSRREIPSATCSRDADLTELWALRTRLTQQAREDGFDVKISPFALMMRATVLALRRFPTLNARIDRDAGEIHLLEPIHLGFAADTDRGLMVPNIKDAHTKSLLQLALELQQLAGAARDGTIGPAALTGGTFTVNNYGAFGNDDGDPIINHPEGGLLGIGAIRARPWVVTDADGAEQLAIRRVARFTLAFDHRICDGGEAGRFVTEVATLCEEPTRLLLHT